MKSNTDKVIVVGASDDLIEVDGAIREEFYAPNKVDQDGTRGLLAFSEGTVLRVTYQNGVWRIAPVKYGSALMQISQAPEDDEDNYSDRAELIGEFKWVVFGRQIAS